MKTTSAWLALGVCLASFTLPSARADIVDWKIGKNIGSNGSKSGWVWNGAKKEALTAALDGNDYAAFQRLAAGLNDEEPAAGGAKNIRYRTGWTSFPNQQGNKIGSFLDPADTITFLVIDGAWSDDTPFTNLPPYYIAELSTEGKPYDDWERDGSEVQATSAGQYSLGRIGSAFTNQAALVIAAGRALPLDGFIPAGLTNGLAEGAEVACSAPAEIVSDGVHYTNLYLVVRETWDADGRRWVVASTNAAGSGGTYAYRHEAASARIAWQYGSDGFLLDAAPSRANGGAVEADRGPDLSGDCYKTGESVQLTARAAAANTFVKWVVDGEDREGQTLSVTMDTNHAVRAVFEPVELTWAGDAEGNVWTNGGTSGWLDGNGAVTGWADGAVAVFTGGASAAIAAEGVTAAAVRIDASGPVTIEGGPLTMIGDARIDAVTTNGAGVFLNAPIAGADGLTISHRGKEAVYEPYLFSNAYVRVFPGVQLGQIARLGASLGGKSIGGGPLAVNAYQVATGSDGILSAQFQLLQGKDLKAVKVSFSNGVDDVYAKAEWARRLRQGSDAEDRRGEDLEINYLDNQPLVSNANNWGYGIFNIRAEILDPDAERFVIGAPTEFTGALTLESGRLEFGEGGMLGTNGVFEGDVRNSGELCTPAGILQTFAGAVTGFGRIRVAGLPGAEPGAAGAAFRSGHYYANSAKWVGGLTVANDAEVSFKYGGGKPDARSLLPNLGRLEARDGGRFVGRETDSYNTASGWPNPFHILSGGVLELDASHVVSKDATGNKFDRNYAIRKIFLEDGGILRNKSGENHVNFLDVKDGGTVEGAAISIAWHQPATFKIHGNRPCLLKANCTLKGDSGGGPRKVTLDVDDVTGDGAPDLVISGNIDWANHESQEIHKTGSGTVVYSGANSYNKQTHIENGTLRFETDRAMAANAPIFLLGTDAAAGAATATLDIGTNRNDVGTLTLKQKGGTLKLGDGGRIEFDASAGTTWGTDAALWIDGALGPQSVRFGTNADGLNESQLDQIKLVGDGTASFKLDPDGWLCRAHPKGTVIILR